MRGELEVRKDLLTTAPSTQLQLRNENVFRVDEFPSSATSSSGVAGAILQTPECSAFIDSCSNAAVTKSNLVSSCQALPPTSEGAAIMAAFNSNLPSQAASDTKAIKEVHV